MFTPPLSRQPSCRTCDHEEHVFTRCGSEFGDTGVLCPCPPHRPLGIYDDPPGGNIVTTYSRVDWEAAPARPGPGPLAAREVVGLVFHWPAMAKPIRGFQAVAAALRAWQKYHMEDQGWSDIAYQVAVDQDGNRYILRGLDTQSAANGNEDVNDELGAVLLILAPGEEPSPKMIREVRRVVVDHRQLFPESDVLLGHSEVRPEATACPGPVVQRHLEQGTFEPVPTPRDLMRVDLAAAIAATKAVLRRAEAPRRPRVAHHAGLSLAALREARDINRGS